MTSSCDKCGMEIDDQDPIPIQQCDQCGDMFCAKCLEPEDHGCLATLTDEVISHDQQ